MVCWPLVGVWGDDAFFVLHICLLGRLPLDARLTQCLEEGQSFVDKYPGSAAQQEMTKIVAKLTGQNVPGHTEC